MSLTLRLLQYSLLFSMCLICYLWGRQSGREEVVKYFKEEMEREFGKFVKKYEQKTQSNSEEQKVEKND